MPLRRSDIVDADAPGVYHCISRCVRRESLLADPARRAWLVRRLEFLADWLAIDVVSFAIMPNHIHLLLAIRPEIVASWSDREVAARRIAVSPNLRWRSRHGVARDAKPTDRELEAILSSQRRLAQARVDLSSLGFFHRLLKEPCARLWNKSDGVTGHFWEGRFKSPRVLDLEALVHVARYIELNEVHAGAATAVPKSAWTSAAVQWQRVVRLLARQGEAILSAPALTADLVGDLLLRRGWEPVFACRAEDACRREAAIPTRKEDRTPAQSKSTWAGAALGIERCPISLVEHLEDLHLVGQLPHPRKPCRIPLGTPGPLAWALRMSFRGQWPGPDELSRSRLAPGSSGANSKRDDIIRAIIAQVESRVREHRGADSLKIPLLEPIRVVAQRGTCYGAQESTRREAFRRGRRRVLTALHQVGFDAA